VFFDPRDWLHGGKNSGKKWFWQEYVTLFA
jgi:hypothetical protein